MMNIFWTKLGLSGVADLVFTQEPKLLCELGDPLEFIEYGESRCRQMGIVDDVEVAEFLFQAFDGEVRSWYLSLPGQVRSSWYHLKYALLEDFGHGQVMESMQLLCQVWWQVPDYEQSFNVLWKVYKRVSFFHDSFLHVLKEKMLEKYRLASIQLQELYEKEVVDDAFQASMQKDATNMGRNLKGVVSNHQSEECSSSSSLYDEPEAMDDQLSDEPTSFCDEESLDVFSEDVRDEGSIIIDEGIMHVLESKASIKELVVEDIHFVVDAMQPMHEEESLDDTWGVGKTQGDMYADLIHEEPFEGDSCDAIDVIESDAWEIASLDEQEPEVDLNAHMVVSVTKASLHIADMFKRTSTGVDEDLDVPKLEGGDEMPILEGLEVYDDATAIVDVYSCGHECKIVGLWSRWALMEMMLVAVLPHVLRTKMYVVGEVLSYGLYQEHLDEDHDAWVNLVEAYQLMDEKVFLAHLFEIWHVVMQPLISKDVGRWNGVPKMFPFDPGGQ